MKLLPDEIGGRKFWLFVALAIFSGIGFFVLSEVLSTLIVAATFAYLLYPLKKKLDGKFSDRQSATILTSSAFLFLMGLVTPIFIVLFRRRQILIDFISSLPNEISIKILEYSFAYPTSELEILAKDWVSGAALKLAESLPSLSLKAFLFMFLLYAILRNPKSIENKILGALPESAEKVLFSYHERIQKTLVGIFAVQTFTAIITFIISLPFYYFLGYDAFISLALLSAALQLVPILGPSILVLALFALEMMAGFIVKASMILVFGIAVIGFLPDAYLRPKLAGRTTGLPASLYFIGFAGGALTLGAIGVLVGPLVIAVILETVELLTE